MKYEEDDVDDQVELKGKIGKRKKMTEAQEKMAGKACPKPHGKVMEAGD